ncbi:MAG: hypothetical protein HN790_18540 [Methylococcales bacterium]|jgi:Tfp pilus assembly major pilin PilA|nr:hypothetical protein [Methylococcales bacterium]
MKAKLLLLACLFMPAASIQANNISTPASLNKKVSSETFAYIRIPNMWGLLSSPKGNAISNALASPAHQTQIAELKAAVEKNILTELEPYTGFALKLVLSRLTSPIEAMAITPKGSPSPIPNLAIRTQLDFKTVGEFKALLAAMSQEIPIQITAPITAEGFGTLQVEAVTIQLHFDSATGMLNMVAGQMVNQKIFDEITSLPDATYPVFQADQQQIDNSGQGLFIWLNAKKILPLAQAGMPPEVSMGLQQMGLLDATSAAAGMGMSNGKGRLQVFLNAPHTGLRKSIPGVNNNFSVTSAGTPGGMFSISILSLELLQGVEKLMQMMSPDDYTQYEATQKQIKEAAGFDARDVLSAIGPETLFFSDDEGSYLAIRLRDPAKFYGILDKLKQMFQLKHEQVTVDGVQHHHLAIPGISFPQSSPDFLMTLLSRSGTHLYWIEDNGYLLMAQIPQMLMEHQKSANRQPIQHWLNEQQRQSGQHSMALLSFTLEDMPTEIYNVYLQLLLMLGDFAEYPIDLYKLPSASQVNLANNGTFGVQFDMSESQIGFGITYESTMIDFLLDPGAGSVVVVGGIMAAVAIPAYQDYITRASVAEGMSIASGYKIAVSEYYYLNNKLPTAEKDLAIDPVRPYGPVESVTMQGEGEIHIKLTGSNLYGSSVVFAPKIENGVVRWACSSKGTSMKYLPSECRVEY